MPSYLVERQADDDDDDVGGCVLKHPLFTGAGIVGGSVIVYDYCQETFRDRERERKNETHYEKMVERLCVREREGGRERERKKLRK